MFCLRRFCRTSIAVLLLTFALPGSSQQNSEVPAPTIRVITHMVLVDVMVTDKQDHVVPGLHADDFEIDENGKAQRIANFSTPVGLSPTPPLPLAFGSRPSSGKQSATTRSSVKPAWREPLTPR